MQKQKSKVAATVTIHGAADMTKQQRKGLAFWLNKTAVFVSQDGDKLSKRFTARYLLPVILLALLGVLVQPMRSAQICNDPNNPAYRLMWEIEEGLSGEVGSEFVIKDPDAKDPCNAGGLPFTVKPYGTWPSWARLTGPNNVDPATTVGLNWLCDTGYDKAGEPNYISYWLMIDRSKAMQGLYNLPVEMNDGDPNGLAYGGERVKVFHKNIPPSLAAVGAKR